ncbi:hypothetical protein RIF29_24863 [Crotalaria pallida]|uniref:Uncharacterized protein n=1 Tax=Crotalaria pallida TaxID=3830 RepID=A0AAN9EMZ8_CROPI
MLEPKSGVKRREGASDLEWGKERRTGVSVDAQLKEKEKGLLMALCCVLDAGSAMIKNQRKRNKSGREDGFGSLGVAVSNKNICNFLVDNLLKHID